jgi:ribonuclease P/MRP protein subunit POP1
LYSTAVLHVRVVVLGRGSPSDMAEVHSIDPQEKQAWLDALEEDEALGRVAWDATEKGKSAIQRVRPCHSVRTRLVAHLVAQLMEQLGEIPTQSTSIIGWVITGNFSLSRGKGFAIATITLGGYVSLMRTALSEKGEPQGWAVVKVRNRDGRIYRLARLELV